MALIPQYKLSTGTQNIYTNTYKGGIKMAQGRTGSGRTQLVPEVHSLLDNMKYEIAEDMDLGVHQGSEDYWGSVSSKNCGKVGGEMVKRLISMAENEMLNGKTP